MDGVGLGMKRGRVAEEIAAAIERGKTPFRAGLGCLGKAGDEVLGGFAHDFCKRPVVLLGDGFEPQIEWIGKLNLCACHDALFTSEADCRQSCTRTGSTLLVCFCDTKERLRFRSEAM